MPDFSLSGKVSRAEVTTDDSSQIVAAVGVYVMASDPAQSVENLAGYNCAILNSEYDAVYTQAAVNEGEAENTGCTVNALPADMSALAEDELADETSGEYGCHTYTYTDTYSGCCYTDTGGNRHIGSYNHTVQRAGGYGCRSYKRFVQSDHYERDIRFDD